MGLIEIVYLLLAITVVAVMAALFLGTKFLDLKADHAEALESLRLRDITVDVQRNTIEAQRRVAVTMQRMLLERGLTPPAMALEDDPLTAGNARRYGSTR